MAFNTQTEQIDSTKDYQFSFVYYESFFDISEKVRRFTSDVEANDFLRKTIEYGLYGVLPEEEDMVWLYGFDAIVANIRAAKRKYNKKIDIPEDELMHLIEEGKTTREIAEYYSCSTDTVLRRKKEYGLL